MASGKSKAKDDIEVISVAPSDRALWRIQRHTARARGRPQLAVRRVIAAAEKIAAAGEVTTVADGRAKRRRLLSQTPPEVHVQPSEEVKKMRLELAQMAAQKANSEALLAVERRQLQELKAQSVAPSFQLAAEKRKSQALQDKSDSLLREKTRLWQEVQELRASQTGRTVPEAQLAAEKRKSQALQEKMASQERRCEGLQRQVQDLQRASQASGTSSSSPNQQVLARQIAQMECRPLQNKAAPVRAALKKKLLVKWHPDKQPSVDHSAIATCVIQEIQNCAEWRR